jgi:SAM-dependent methyltransferase
MTEKHTANSTCTSQIIKATPEEAYAAFMDPAVLVAWLPPARMTGKIHEFDGRVGGGYRMSLFYPADERVFRGKTADKEDMVKVRFVELTPARRIVETIDFVTTDPALQGEMRMAATFEPVADGTKLTMLFENLPPGLRPEDNEAGARLSLGQLAKRFEPTGEGSPDNDKVFAGSIPAIYERYLVPLIFQPYAVDMAQRVAARKPARVLEIAAGTGALTRQLAAVLPTNAAIVATDLNQAMLDVAAAVGTSRPVAWRQADAMQLPFGDAEFDVVVCQFGVMFFPDKAKAFAEVRRVLRPGGAFLFSAWDRIEENELVSTVSQALATLYPEDPPRFMARSPHGYHDPAAMARDLEAGGFDAAPDMQVVAARARAASPEIPATAYLQGSPLRGEIEARGKLTLDEATDAAAHAIARKFGPGPLDTRIQAHVVTIER